ncbi:MAG: hypothetical protein JWN18_41 [Parcubacteria group bacterium]|nr:hypothetical protein [Parcubacteria group bacterium]
MNEPDLLAHEEASRLGFSLALMWGSEIVEHRTNECTINDVSQIQLYWSRTQTDGNRIKGELLLKELADKPVLNVVDMQYLQRNGHLIPTMTGQDDPRGGSAMLYPHHVIPFWGTIFRWKNSGDLFVLCLVPDFAIRTEVSVGHEVTRSLSDSFGFESPAAMRRAI